MYFPFSFMNFIFQLGKDVINYIQNELESLEREQKQIDRHAALLEKEIRKVMDTGNVDFLLNHCHCCCQLCACEMMTLLKVHWIGV